MREFAKTFIGRLTGALYAPPDAGVAEADAAAETVTGELISVWCYIQSPRNVGEAGHVCALADLKWEGNPPGVLTSAGKVYQLAGPVLGENNADVVPHIGHMVSVTGEVSEKDGIRILTASAMKMVSR